MLNGRPGLRSMHRRRASNAGFSLIELSIALVVTAVLTTLTLPSFERQLQRARRADALVAALQVQTAQERFRSEAAGYGSLTQIGAPSTSAGGHYRLELNLLDPDAYELVATATGLQARDAACRYLKLSSASLNVVHASGPDDRVANDNAQNRRCWDLR